MLSGSLHFGDKSEYEGGAPENPRVARDGVSFLPVARSDSTSRNDHSPSGCPGRGELNLRLCGQRLVEVHVATLGGDYRYVKFLTEKLELAEVAEIQTRISTTLLRSKPSSMAAVLRSRVTVLVPIERTKPSGTSAMKPF